MKCKDRSDREIKIGDYVLHAGRQGSLLFTEYGRVVGFGETPLGMTRSIETVKVFKPCHAKIVTISRPNDYLLIVEPYQIPHIERIDCASVEVEFPDHCSVCNLTTHEKDELKP